MKKAAWRMLEDGPLGPASERRVKQATGPGCIWQGAHVSRDRGSKGTPDK